jgi:hypothetical protein
MLRIPQLVSSKLKMSGARTRSGIKPSVTAPECGYQCHSRVASQDYIFTAYPKS